MTWWWYAMFWYDHSSTSPTVKNETLYSLHGNLCNLVISFIAPLNQIVSFTYFVSLSWRSLQTIYFEVCIHTETNTLRIYKKLSVVPSCPIFSTFGYVNINNMLKFKIAHLVGWVILMFHDRLSNKHVTSTQVYVQIEMSYNVSNIQHTPRIASLSFSW